RGAARQVPPEDESEVVRGAAQAELAVGPEAAVELDAGGEVLRAERAVLGPRGQGERAAHADRVAELPVLLGEVLLRDQVLGEVPAAELAREDDLGLEL